MMNEIPEISPLPWRVSEYGGALSPVDVVIVDANNVVMLRMETTRNKGLNAQAKRTADAIVKAMNRKRKKD
jgi:hypothetical protein